MQIAARPVTDAPTDTGRAPVKMSKAMREAELIKDSLEPIELPPPSDPWGNAAIGIIGLEVAILLTLVTRWFVLFWMRRLRSPHRRARLRLKSKTLASLDQRSLFRELHAILAEYMSATTGLPAKSQTSAEILASLEKARFATIPGLNDFLTASDRARFAANATSQNEPQHAIQQCTQILKAIRKAIRKGRPRRAR